MAVAPGINPGDITLINGVEYIWDGVTWDKNTVTSQNFTADAPVTVDAVNSDVHHGFDITKLYPV